MPPASIVDPSAKGATRLTWAKLVRQWIDFLYGLVGEGSITEVLNNNFQTYTGTDNIPDNWNFTPYSNGSGTLDTDTTSFGAKSFRIDIGATSGGGGYLDSYVSGGKGALVPWNPAKSFYASWWYKTTNPTSDNGVMVNWYTSKGIYILSATLWASDSGQPSTWTLLGGAVLPGGGLGQIPSNAYFYSLSFYGGMPVTSLGGSVWYAQINSGFDVSFTGNSTVFTSGGTFIPPGNCFRVRVRLWGAGGNSAPGTCGGGSGYCEGYLNVVHGQPFFVTVGTPTLGAGESSVSFGGTTLVASPGGTPNGGNSSGGYLNLWGQGGGSIDGGGTYGTPPTFNGGGNFPGGGAYNGDGGHGLVIIEW